MRTHDLKVGDLVHLPNEETFVGTVSVTSPDTNRITVSYGPGITHDGDAESWTRLSREGK